uniref:DNA sliding clamp PCNA n=1 Tax=Isodiametra pulchra TaxID=504439 RepID=D2T1D9_ISOPU|nr:PCNA-like protein [Isodiametra pulchra]
MFEAHMVDAHVFRKIFEAAKELLEDASFDCTSDGLSLQAMDAIHVSLVAVQLRSEGFELYRCDRAMNMGFKVAGLLKILKCAGSKDSLTMRAEDNADKCSFIFESPNKDKVSQFDFSLTDIDQEHLQVPEQDYQVNIKMPSAEFSRICRDLANFGDTVQISCTKGQIQFAANGDLGTANIRLQEKNNVDDDGDKISIEVEEPLSLSFAVRYLNNFAKAQVLSDTVSLMLTPKTPMVVEYQIGDYGHIRFYLAPKIDDEEDEDASQSQTQNMKDEDED